MTTKIKVLLFKTLLSCTLLICSIVCAKEINIATVDTSNRGYLNADGQVLGSSYEIVNSIVNDSGFTYKNTLMPFGRVLGYLGSGDIDVALLVPNETTNKVSIPLEYIQDVNFIVVGRNNLSIKRLTDIRGKSVGYLRLTPTAVEALKSLDVMKVEGSKYSHMIEMLMRGRIDVLFGPESNIFWALKNLGYARQELGEPLLIEKLDMYLVYSKKVADKSIMSALTSSAKKLKANNTIQEIIHKYEDSKPH
ncbi:substrate-binding periplasmic protein [Paraglaciecola sp. 2405UD69-4]|uniref:substrate-binding periplasmic protein n=1 Tax=Paraglaciecola sp. 2405UD69-4 TaxID=3391836 RepID=UPI0039C9CD06